MIVLNEEGGGLVEVSSWDELFERPHYKSDVDPKQVKLKDIIGVYTLNPKHKCGLSNCHTPHHKGYIASFDCGSETNIGHVCGSKYLEGVSFETAKRDFKRRSNAVRYRENLSEVMHQLDGRMAQINDIWMGQTGAEKRQGFVHGWMTTGFDQTTVNRLLERSKRGESVIYQSKTITDEDEKDIAELVGGGSSFSNEAVGVISGIRAVKDYKRLRLILQEQLYSQMLAFSQLDIESLTFDDLSRWSKWANKIEHRLAEAKEINEECGRFLRQDNIQLIQASKHLL